MVSSFSFAARKHRNTLNAPSYELGALVSQIFVSCFDSFAFFILFLLFASFLIKLFILK